MAVAAYDSDLTSANGGEIAVGNTVTDAGVWDESSDAAWDDAGVPDDEVNFYINYANCISAQFTKTGQGTIIYDHTADVTVDTDGAILIWYFWASPASLSTFANGGIRILHGEDVGNFIWWNCSGSDFEPNPLGGWYCYALNPSIAGGTTVGTVALPGSAFGIATNATAQARGYPSAVNAVRVGRCTLEVTAGQAGDYGTFVGMEVFDTSTNVRYGLFQNIGGAYRWQGLISLGTAATAVDFRDGNVAINVANTPNVTSNFNKIEVHNAGSNIEWNNVVMSSPGVNNLVAATASRGTFEMIDQADLAFSGCSFTDMGKFTFSKGAAKTVTVNGTTFRRCDLITTGGASLDGCLIDDSFAVLTSSLICASPTEAALISNTSFISSVNGGNGLQIGDGSTVFSTQTITLTGLDFSGYDTANPGVANDKAIWVNSATGGGTITLNISGGSGVTAAYHVRATNCTVVVSADVTVTFTGMRDYTEVLVQKVSDGSTIAHSEDHLDTGGGAQGGTTDNRSFSFSAPAATEVKYTLLSVNPNGPDYEIIFVPSYAVPSANASIAIAQRLDRNSI